MVPYHSIDISATRRVAPRRTGVAMSHAEQPLRSVLSFDEVDQTSAPLLVSEPASWPGPPLRLLHNRPHGELFVPPMAEDLVVLQMAGETDLEGTLERPFSRQRTGPGHLFLIPRGEPSRWLWTEPCEVLQIPLAPGLLVSMLGAAEVDVARLELAARFAADDPLLHQLGLALLGELRERGSAGRLYVESLSRAMVAQLLRRHAHDAKGPPRARGLSAASLRLVLEYIGDNLAQELTTTEIAALAGVSPFHFARQFRESVGVPLHAYVRERRIEAARRLLLTCDLTIAAVAALTGFADQSHLSRDFKARYGVTPGSIRQRR
jgi:AraC family transcriptional regulator